MSSPPALMPTRRAAAAVAVSAAPRSAAGAAAKPKSFAQKALEKLGLKRPIDLALHLPLRWEDETRIVRLADAHDGDIAQIEATVTASEVRLGGRRQLLVTVDDGSDCCTLRFFTFYPSQQKALAVGSRLRIRGELRGGFAGWTMMHPVWRAAGGPLPQTLTSVYPTIAGLPQPYLRRAIEAGLARADLSDTLAGLAPLPAVDGDGAAPEPAPSQAWSLHAALDHLHHPPPAASIAALEDRNHPAWQRLKAEELLAQQIAQLQARAERELLQAPPLAAKQGGLHAQLLASLPFELTGAQQRVAEEIGADLARATPMNRLLQGDVGSGKTVLAALAATIAIDAGWQCALMVPTEILASQHFAKLVGWLQPLGIRVAWLVGSQGKKERTEMLAQIASGAATLVIGTHAIIQSQVQFARLSLAIIDEQHRFGVAQRLALRAKMIAPALNEPHLLMMSATPIPRTLAMSHYADLDVSTLDELPPGRTPVVTRLIPDARRDEVVARIGGQLQAGRQAYWVCPLIEESEALDLANATETHAALAEALPEATVALLHSRMSTADKKAVMARFVAGETDLLVSTTVIEVGVDVPNASLMVIEHAERFGLSQLHQLRGRVGRGAAASACVLLFAAGESGKLGEIARARLQAMVQSNDGFEIARRDLELRGPGQFLGARQSGLPLLRFADLATDTALLNWAHTQAAELLLQRPQVAEQHVQRWLAGNADYLKV
ncbi:MAG: ATP-dependent DNA helicase RecG [Burkholderiales bacterium]